MRVIRTIDGMLPKKTIRICSNIKPWFNKSLRIEYRKLNRLKHSAQNFGLDCLYDKISTIYWIWRITANIVLVGCIAQESIINKRIQDSKASYFTNLTHLNKDNPKKFWNAISAVTTPK